VSADELSIEGISPTRPKSAIVDALDERAKADDARPPPSPSIDPAGDLRTITALRIGQLVQEQAAGGFVDVAELARLAGVLKSLAEKDEPKPEPHGPGEYDWELLDPDEFRLLHDLLAKARR
jgi:hypothetical protein